MTATPLFSVGSVLDEKPACLWSQATANQAACFLNVVERESTLLPRGRALFGFFDDFLPPLSPSLRILILRDASSNTACVGLR